MNKILLFCGITLCCACSKTISPVWEIPDPDLDEIAMIRMDPNWGPAVIYNPNTCEEIAEACGFFRLHAYAHDHLKHTMLGEPDDYPASQEKAADCFAAKYGKPENTRAAYELFLNKDRNPEWKIHGDPEKRAQTIKACASQKNKWNG